MNTELEARVKAIADKTPWPHLRTRWLAHSELGATLGSGIELEIAPGEFYEAHRHVGVERVVYVAEGRGLHHGSGGTQSLSRNDILVLANGEWHGFENNTKANAKIWLLYAPSPSFPIDSYEKASSDASLGSTLVKRNLLTVSDDPSISVPERGFVNMNVIWDGAKGADQITFGIAFFRAGARHKWHRHPHGDEIIYTVSGEWSHLTEAHRIPMKPGSFEYSPAGEYHTAETDSSPADVIFVYFGGSSLDAVGYQRKPDD